MSTYSDWQQRQLDVASGAEMDRVAEQRIAPRLPRIRSSSCASCHR